MVGVGGFAGGNAAKAVLSSGELGSIIGTSANSDGLSIDLTTGKFAKKPNILTGILTINNKLLPTIRPITKKLLLTMRPVIVMVLPIT